MPSPRRASWRLALVPLTVAVLAGCSASPAARADQPARLSGAPVPVSPTTTAAPAPSTTTTTSSTAATTTPSPAHLRPAWLGTRPLALRPDGVGRARPTPPELVDRRLSPSQELEPVPPPGAPFAATVAVVPPDVAARSTWSPDCPVGLDELRYATVTFWGFDDRPHRGELLAHAGVVDDLVAVFRRLFDARFPIEEMRVIGPEELDVPPTGDGNTTTAFVCRPVTGGSSWSEHAKGLAVDVNPFHNPYVKRDVVVPELASAYLDRGATWPGIVRAGDTATAAFGDIGWGWGGTWRSSKDWMHFSASGR